VCAAELASESAREGGQAVYGTIMRARVKPGHREMLESMMKEQTGRELELPGFHSFDVAWEDKDPDRLVLVVRFEDKESYVANAESPEQDAEYRRMLTHLEGEPEWIDIHWGAHVGEDVTS
jgi:quinol monooxygenase YgiN